MTRPVLLAANAYYEAGLNVIPIHTDGSKKPRVCWKRYTSDRYPWYQAQHWFVGSAPSGIALLCGATSGGLEVIDVDNEGVFEPWRTLVDARAPGLLERLPMVRTPRPGRHIYYRCPEIEGNTVLARERVGEEIKALIETRGQGGYVLAPGSPPATHPSGRSYELVQGSLEAIPTIEPGEREVLFSCARQLDRVPPDPVEELTARIRAEFRRCPRLSREEALGELARFTLAADGGGDRPGDDYNRRATWAEVLEPHGWECVRSSGGTDYWRRPGKDAEGHSASTNHAGFDRLYVFSSSAAPLEVGRPYSKFAAYAILNYGGDYSAAAKELARLGYGIPEPGSNI